MGMLCTPKLTPAFSLQHPNLFYKDYHNVFQKMLRNKVDKKLTTRGGTCSCT
jgi:hypothetical protein